MRCTQCGGQNITAQQVTVKKNNITPLVWGLTIALSVFTAFIPFMIAVAFNSQTVNKLITVCPDCGSVRTIKDLPDTLL